MKSLYVRVVVFDPLEDDEFTISDGIQVDVVKINDFNPLVGFNRRSLKYDVDDDVFTVNAPRYHVSQSHYLRVSFKKVNFSKVNGQLLAANEVETIPLTSLLPGSFTLLGFWLG